MAPRQEARSSPEEPYHPHSIRHNHPAEFRSRAQGIGRDPEELRQNGACGLVGEVLDTLTRREAARVCRIYLQLLDLSDLEHLDLVVEAYHGEPFEAE